MKIYRVHELPNGANLRTIGIYNSEGIVYIRKGLPTLIQIVVLIHKVGHHIESKIRSFFYHLWGHRTPISNCGFELWRVFMEEKDALICRKWLPNQKENL